jgi:crotonobetainyl-CoA:carnitine CoA-transferase CaiB-like acyl-CoA transferase
VLEHASWLALESAAEALAESSGRVGRRVHVDVLELLDQRGLKPQGTVSANGSCRLLPTQDGWVAISLNRSDDWELLPALFGTDLAEGDWEAVARAAAAMFGAELEAGAAELGLALAVLPAEPPTLDAPARITLTEPHAAEPHDTERQLARVVDLSALWAGPLCASLLHRAGAKVLAVESTTRPQGVREYPADELVSLDFAGAKGRAELHRLVQGADVVITAARPRALRGLDLDPLAMTQSTPGLTWVAISAYGMTGACSNRIGYGDDTAVAGGLVDRDPTPAFVGDAIADPITGLYATVAALEVFASGGGVVDIALRDAAAYVAQAAR